MRWDGQQIDTDSPGALPGLTKLKTLVRSVTTPEFADITFHEVLAKSALNKVPGQSAMPFGWTINPYRGCSHACSYCLDPATLILRGDGRQVPLRDIEVGDEIYGTETQGRYRRYVKTKVLAKWATIKHAYRITLADGTKIVASGDHRFLTERGWKHTIPAGPGDGQRPYLTTNNALVGFGLMGSRNVHVSEPLEQSYRRGYLTGLIRGDGMIFEKTYPPRKGGGSTITAFRLALADSEGLDRTRTYLAREGVVTRDSMFAPTFENRRAMTAINTAKRADVSRIRELISWPTDSDESWRRGFLAGIFDAEGSCSQGALRISNKDDRILAEICASLAYFDIDHVSEPVKANGVGSVRVRGGLPSRSRFSDLTKPAITRKLSIEGAAVKSDADLRVVSIEDLGIEIDMIDITTGTGDFIANGVISHNCFARPTHEYLEFNRGKDFDNEIVVKVNIAEVLAKELSKPTWSKHPVALGTNTDPYQRAEGRYRLMPGIIAALADSGTPFSILTKGTLLRRDLPLLAEAAERVPVDLAMSIAIFDDELQQSVEPGTPTAKARLATVTAAREHGLDCSVFMMPILPYLTDSRAHLDEALGQIKEAGATSVLYTALHLKPGVKEWYYQWLDRAHPELAEQYSRMYFGRSTYAPKAYRKWLADRIQPLIRKHGLQRGVEDPSTGAVRSKALAIRRDGENGFDRSLIAEELSPLRASAAVELGGSTLF